MCDECKKPLDNVRGWYVLQNGDVTVATCEACRPTLIARGYTVLVQAKGLDRYIEQEHNND